MAARIRSWRNVWLVVSAIIAGAVAAIFWPRPPAEPDSLNVPLGVEQAAIVTYSGPAIALAPYKRGVAVNVRIAGITEEPGARDLRRALHRQSRRHLRSQRLSRRRGWQPARGIALLQIPRRSQALQRSRCAHPRNGADRHRRRRALLRDARRAGRVLDRLAAPAHLLQAAAAARARGASAARTHAGRIAAGRAGPTRKRHARRRRPGQDSKCSSCAAGGKSWPSPVSR